MTESVISYHGAFDAGEDVHLGFGAAILDQVARRDEAQLTGIVRRWNVTEPQVGQK